MSAAWIKVDDVVAHADALRQARRSLDGATTRRTVNIDTGFFDLAEWELAGALAAVSSAVEGIRQQVSTLADGIELLALRAAQVDVAAALAMLAPGGGTPRTSAR